MSRPVIRSLSVDRAVSMMIGTFAVSVRPRIIRQTSTPFNTGRFKSSRTRSGSSSATLFRAVSPLPAISTTNPPSRSSACLMSPAMSFSSSTTRTRVRPELMGIPGVNLVNLRFRAVTETLNVGYTSRRYETSAPFDVPFVPQARRGPLTGEDAADFGDQGVGRAGLGHEPVAAGACCTLQFAGFVVSGQCHDGNMRRARIVLETTGGFPPIEDGKAQIHQDNVRRMSGRVRQR